VVANIGSLNEKSLHADLKRWYAQPGDRFELLVDGFVIDIGRGELLIEIQTRNFSALKPKLAKLIAQHPVRLVYPIAQERWIVKLADDEQGILSRRKSPRRGAFTDLFKELVSFPHLLAEPNFSLEALLIQEEERRVYDGKRAWRRKGWVTHERRLLAVVDRRCFDTPADLATLLPAGLPDPFTTTDLAAALGQPRRLAGQMAYCLHKVGVLGRVGKRGRALLYERAV
jgi:hypothetical protein